jgi:hypothetical protein
MEIPTGPQANKAMHENVSFHLKKFVVIKFMFLSDDAAKVAGPPHPEDDAFDQTCFSSPKFARTLN